MEPLQQLGLAMGTAWTSGINLYATIAALGIAQASGLVQLPPGLEVLANPAVIVVVVFVGVWAAFQHPYVMLVLVLGFLALAIYLVPKILRTLRALFRKITGKNKTPTDYGLQATGKDSAVAPRSL